MMPCRQRRSRMRAEGDNSFEEVEPMQPMTEKTALALIDAIERNTVALQAIQDLTEAIKSGA